MPSDQTTLLVTRSLSQVPRPVTSNARVSRSWASRIRLLALRGFLAFPELPAGLVQSRADGVGLLQGIGHDERYSFASPQLRARGNALDGRPSFAEHGCKKQRQRQRPAPPRGAATGSAGRALPSPSSGPRPQLSSQRVRRCMGAQNVSPVRFVVVQTPSLSLVCFSVSGANVLPMNCSWSLSRARTCCCGRRSQLPSATIRAAQQGHQ